MTPTRCPAKSNRLARPLTGVERGTGEAGQARELRDIGRRQAAGRHDQEAGRHLEAVVGADRPEPGRLIEGRRPHPAAEPDVAPQAEPVGHVMEVAQDLRLARVPLGPLPTPAAAPRRNW